MAEARPVPRLRFPEFRNAGPWERKRLGETCETFSGGTPTAGHQDYYEGTIPFIRSAEIGLTKTDLSISEIGFQESSASFVHEGDILLALYGANSGNVAISKIDGAINQAILCIKPNIDNIIFIYQLLMYRKNWIITRYLQGGQGNLSGEIVKSVVLEFPPLTEQQKIADCLSSLDDLIRAEEDSAKALRAHKRGLMQQLFPAPGETTPRLRFPEFRDAGTWERKRLGEMGKTVSGGTPDSTIAAYWGGGGAFPAYWQRKPLSEVSTPVKRKSAGGDHPVMTISAKSGFLMQADKFARDMAGRSVERYTLLHKGEFAYNKGNSKTAPYGCVFRLDCDTALVPFVYYCFALKPGLDPEFYEHLFSAGALNHQLSRLINSGVRNDGLLNLYSDDFFNCRVPVPPIEEQKCIAKALTSLDDLIRAQEERVEALRDHKRGLMQQLFPSEVG